MREQEKKKAGEVTGFDAEDKKAEKGSGGPANNGPENKE